MRHKQAIKMVLMIMSYWAQNNFLIKHLLINQTIYSLNYALSLYKTETSSKRMWMWLESKQQQWLHTWVVNEV